VKNGPSGYPSGSSRGWGGYRIQISNVLSYEDQLAIGY